MVAMRRHDTRTANVDMVSMITTTIGMTRRSNLGAVRESWTAPLYILSADFAEVLPPDEDPMPLDGNPHPLPGHLLPQLGNFVLPPYPELGWNEPPVQNQPFEGFMGQNIHMHPDQQHGEEDEAEVFQESDSIVINHSDNSSVNSVHPAQIIVNFCQFNYNVSSEDITTLLVGAKKVNSAAYGPALPPEMQWTSMFEVLLKKLPDVRVPPAVLVQSVFCNVAKSWPFASSAETSTVEQTSLPLARRIIFEDIPMIDSDQECSFSFSDLSNDNTELSPVIDSVVPYNQSDLTTSKMAKKKGRKRETPSVESEVRRSTRFQVKQNGFKLEPMRDKPTPKKKPRSAKPFPEEPVTPFTPIPLLQKVGQALEVPEEEMTVDKLMAGPEKDLPKNDSNE
jgi:hypothetical protein